MPFPWPTACSAVLVIAWQYLLLHPQWVPGNGWLPPLPRADFLWLALTCFALLMTWDLRRFKRANKRHHQQLDKYRAQIDELFETRRELGTRARTYSDHADKLKMFISERLLEYIEYDEKFLHFKNIASEVRHNGVISYDRTQTALQLAQSRCAPEDAEVYQQAADALLYLWDLLDLSTTDNIALHVANRIYDCEEHYFQAQLNPEEASQVPLQPTFRMSHALRRALLPIVEDPGALGLARDWAADGSYRDARFAVTMQGEGEMLGHENHMVLLIENLLNNALFYAQQKASRQSYNPVTIQLGEDAGNLSLRIYNRGPQINEEEKERIYQLGYSSRRVREHHGKGLGLYFVHEITRGFEGSIGFSNIDNREDKVTLSVKLANGELLSQQIGIVVVAGKPMCQLLESGAQVARRHDWSYAAAISSIEISSELAPQPQLLAALASGEERQHIDANDPLRAYWMLDLRNRKRSATLRFTPLDVRGVEFSLGFASARARLEQQD